MEIISVDLFLGICIFLIGASMGSFINMAAYRIPLDLSIITPRSYCNHCKTVLPIRALIPIFGYFFARGKCTGCQKRIPWEYPLIEGLCGFFFLLFYNYYIGFLPYPISFEEFKLPIFLNFITVLWLFSTGLLLSIIDLKHRILPDVIVIPGIIVGFILGGLNQNLGFLQSFVGICVGGGGLFLISKLYTLIRKKEGLGFGDVKYLAFLGAVLGWEGTVFTLFLASILGSLIGIPILLLQKKHLHTPIPFGPFLALSGLIYFIIAKNFSVL